jgi:hypothetical protein
MLSPIWADDVLATDNIDLPSVTVAFEQLKASFFKTCNNIKPSSKFNQSIFMEFLVRMQLIKPVYSEGMLNLAKMRVNPFNSAILSKIDFEEYPTIGLFVDKVVCGLQENSITSLFVRRCIALNISPISNVEYLTSKNTQRLATNQEIGDDVYRAVHYCFLLHTITKQITTDAHCPHWRQDCHITQSEGGPLIKLVYDRFQKARWQDMPDCMTYMSLFEQAKLITIDPPFESYVTATVDKFQNTSAYNKDTKLTKWCTVGSSLGMSVNVLEAMSQDIVDNNEENAKAGYTLMIDNGLTGLHSLDHLNRRVTSKKLPSFGECIGPTPRLWVDLYQSWNAAFIMNYNTAPWFLAKLFCPAVGNYASEPSWYMYSRVVALYLHLHFELFSRAIKKNNCHSPYIWGKSINQPFIHLWGNTNLKYANVYLKQCDRLTPSKQHTLIRSIRPKPLKSILKLVWMFLKRKSMKSRRKKKTEDASPPQEHTRINLFLSIISKCTGLNLEENYLEKSDGLPIMVSKLVNKSADKKIISKKTGMPIMSVFEKIQNSGKRHTRATQTKKRGL